MAHLKAKLSTRSPYWISEHRYYELKHYCLQYPEWKKLYLSLSPDPVRHADITVKHMPSDHTEELAIQRAELKRNMDLIERVALSLDQALGPYILKAVTENIPFKTLQMIYGIPCGKDLYYDNYRKFFRRLSEEKGL